MERAKQDRKLYIDLLRITACISVVMLHSASQSWYGLPVTSLPWVVTNSYDAISRFGVPVFVMISGMLFLSRPGQVDVKRLYRNNILRLAIAYVFWSVAYGMWNSRNLFGTPEGSVKKYIENIILGEYHLWFVPMLVGIYVILPVIKTFVDHSSKKQLAYFLWVFVAVQVGKGTILILDVPQIGKVLLDMVHVELAGSYVGYFVLGYYLYHYGLSGKLCRVLYVLGIAGAVLAAVVSTLMSVHNGGPSAAAFDSYSPFTFLASVAVFVWFQEKLSGKHFGKRAESVIRELSANTFGVYLLHLWVLEVLSGMGIHSMTINNIVGLPLLTILCFVLCNVMIAVIRRIPFVGKYIC